MRLFPVVSLRSTTGYCLLSLWDEKLRYFINDALGYEEWKSALDTLARRHGLLLPSTVRPTGESRVMQVVLGKQDPLGDYSCRSASIGFILAARMAG